MKLRRRLLPSVRALLAHRARVGLVVASVAIGVASVLVMTGIGLAARRELLGGIEGMGTDLLVVRPAPVKTLTARRAVRGVVTTLRPEDADAISALPVVAAVAPGVEAGARVKANGVSMATSVLGTTPAFARVRRFRVRQGRFLDEADDRAAARVAVLGARIAASLFPGGEPVGATLRVRGVPFEVVGVLAPRGASLSGMDEDALVLVPLRTALRRVANVAWLSSIAVAVKPPSSAEEGARAIRRLLADRHRRPDDVAVQSQARIVEMRREMAGTLTRVSAALAGVSLLVAGAGILALMLLSVRERRGEIGLRLAVGATPRDVFLQFLVEAALLSLAGWAAGVAGGSAAAVAVERGTSWAVALPAPAFLSTLGMALATGLVAGVAPALAASRVTPAAALTAS